MALGTMSGTSYMQQFCRNGPTPWIEAVIQSYGAQEGSSRSKLHSYVLAVGQMSQSQDLVCSNPTSLVYLSDGLVQIPALLTASAWEHLTTHEDRDTSTSLLNTAVLVGEYQLQFHMAPEMTKCTFYLVVQKMTVTATGPLKHNIPSCTTLASVRQKICDTWKALKCQQAQDSQTSQCGLDLSELLGEWQHDCMQDILEDVHERMMDSSRPQASTSLPSHLDTSTMTTWDFHRLRDKGVKHFSVPIKCLLIPEEDTPQLIREPHVGRKPPSQISAAFEDRKTDLPTMSSSPGALQPSEDHEESQKADENSTPCVEDDMLYENKILGLIDSDIRPLSNPWDIFPPPGFTSSSSDASLPETSPQSPQKNPTDLESQAGESANIQLPAHSFLPPYQNRPHTADCLSTPGPSTSPSVSLQDPFTRLVPSPGEPHNDTARRKRLNLDQEKKPAEKKSGKAKRKRCDSTPERRMNKVDEEEEEAGISGSPPSWLFDSHSGSSCRDRSLPQQGGGEQRRAVTVHSDGRPFSYSYRVSGQTVQDFCRLKVADSLLRWAVKRLVAPQHTDEPRKASNQTPRRATPRHAAPAEC